MNSTPAALSLVETTEEQLCAIERCDSFIARAQQQTSFSSAVVAHVIRSLRERRDAALATLRGQMVDLEARAEDARCSREDTERRVQELRFSLDEVALRAAIGEIDTSEDKSLASQLSEAEQQLSVARLACERLDTLLARCQEQLSLQPVPVLAAQTAPHVDPEADDPWAIEDVDPFAMPEASPALLPDATRRPSLLVNEGIDGEECFALTSAKITVGRGRGSDLQLRGDAKISRSHLSIVSEEGLWWIEDHSGNGTLVNGELLLNGRRRLYGGEELIVGETFLRFCFD